MAKTAFAYLWIALFCALFGAVYESFSHEVYSYYMLYAFAFPLAGGALPFFSLTLFALPVPGRLPLNLYHAGIAAWTVGCILQGVLAIYGTSNRLIFLYWIVGTIFCFLGIMLYLLQTIRTRFLTRGKEPYDI